MADGRRQFRSTPDAEGPADLTAVEPAAAPDYLPRQQDAGRPSRGPASLRIVMDLALPTLVQQVFNLVIGLTDTWVAGNGTDESLNHAAAAAVGTMTYLQWFAGLMTAALSVGATAIVARSIGARRPRVANRVAGTSVTAAFLVGLTVAVVFFLGADQIVTLCRLDGMAHTFGRQYLQIMAITLCLQSTGMIGMACLYGAGDTFRPMLITGVIALVNAILVPTLAYGKFGLPAMGIRGNALGTMIAYSISGIATMFLLLSGWAKLRLQMRHFRLIPHVLWRVLRIGIPSWAESMLLWAGQIAIVLFVCKMNDTQLSDMLHNTVEKISGTTMSAHIAVLRIESFAFLPGMGFGIAASALVGQYLGSGQPREARRAARITMWLTFILMTLAALPMVLFPSALVHLLVKDANTVAIGCWPMILAGLAQPGFAVAIIMSSALKGAGETVWPMLATILGIFAVRFPIVLFLAWYLFPHLGHPIWGLSAVWVGIFADLNFRAVVNSIVFKLGRWQRKTV